MQKSIHLLRETIKSLIYEAHDASHSDLQSMFNALRRKHKYFEKKFTSTHQAKQEFELLSNNLFLSKRMVLDSEFVHHGGVTTRKFVSDKKEMKKMRRRGIPLGDIISRVYFSYIPPGGEHPKYGIVDSAWLVSISFTLDII